MEEHLPQRTEETWVKRGGQVSAMDSPEGAKQEEESILASACNLEASEGPAAPGDRALSPFVSYLPHPGFIQSSSQIVTDLCEHNSFRAVNSQDQN